jgi:hypothetical protein
MLGFGFDELSDVVQTPGCQGRGQRDWSRSLLEIRIGLLRQALGDARAS